MSEKRSASRPARQKKGHIPELWLFLLALLIGLIILAMISSFFTEFRLFLRQ